MLMYAYNADVCWRMLAYARWRRSSVSLVAKCILRASPRVSRRLLSRELQEVHLQLVELQVVELQEEEEEEVAESLIWTLFSSFS